jgi:tRNA(Ile)-lysidine synthase
MLSAECFAMYHIAVLELSERVLRYIRRQALLQAGDRVAVAVSGGADSVGLLRILLELRKELGIVLSVAHFNHGLRGSESDAEEQFVADLAKGHKLVFRREAGEVKRAATERHWSVEAAARKLRYEYFERLLAEGEVNRVATGHTLDDQAETVLMRVVRGAGTRGLAGIYPSRLSSVVGRQEKGPPLSAVTSQPSIVRPLLSIGRVDLESFLRGLGQVWREDSSNRDLRFARNRVRHGILPRLERALNPAAREALAETSELARAEEEYWQRELERVLPSVLQDGPRAPSASPSASLGPSAERAGSGATLRTKALLELPLALRRRVIRAACEALGLRLEFRHVEEILDVATGAAKAAALPHDWRAARRGNGIEIRVGVPETRDYEYALPVPGIVAIPETGITLEAMLIPGHAGYNPEHCLEPSLLRSGLKVRNWRAGDRFWPAHSKAPKKIKELLQERHLAGFEKKLWPVVVSGDEIVWMRGFAVPARFGLRVGDGDAVVIREVPFADV